MRVTSSSDNGPAVRDRMPSETSSARRVVDGPSRTALDTEGSKRNSGALIFDGGWCSNGTQLRVFRELRFLGTFAPFLRASLSPIAIACLRLFTRPPLPPGPDFKVPRFRRRIALPTLLLAARLYFRWLLFFRAGINPPVASDQQRTTAGSHKSRRVRCASRRRLCATFENL